MSAVLSSIRRILPMLDVRLDKYYPSGTSSLLSGRNDALSLLRCEVETARIDFEVEAAAVRAGTLSWHGPRPKADAFRRSLLRFNACLLDGTIPPDLNLKTRRKPW
jgi:hypothetical protein